MPNDDHFDAVEAMCQLREDEVLRWVAYRLEQNAPPLEIADTLSAGLERLGARFAEGTVFIPELVSGGEIFFRAMELLTPAIEASGSQTRNLGTVIMGTVEGDLHDLGQTLVSVTLTAAGFRVINLGCDVDAQRFVEEAERSAADVVGLSALLTTTMQSQRTVIEALEAAGLRSRTRVIVGGAVANQRWADEIGADAFGADAIDALNKVRALVGINA
jgi:methylmalonyl-CoA mutase cobalamin-binding domain/chain